MEEKINLEYKVLNLFLKTKKQGAQFIFENEKKQKQPTKFFNKSFFLYDKSNIVKKSFLTEINKFLSIFGSITFSGHVKNNLLPISSSEKPIEFFLEANNLKDLLELQLTKIDGTFLQTKDKKLHEFFIVQIGKKRNMQKPLDSLFVRGL